MNLLADGSKEKGYVVSLMKKNSLEGVTKTKKRFSLNSKWVFTSVVIVLALAAPLSVVLNRVPSFVVSADKNSVEVADGKVLGASQITLSPLNLREEKSIVASYTVGDRRVIVLKKFLEQKNSPLADYADVVVGEADKYGMDYRLVVGIAGVESGYCRITTQIVEAPSKESHNCWGWGKNGNNFTVFSGWDDAIKTITRGIARGYGNNPTPEEMQYMYCQSCRGSSDWTNYVKGNMSDIRDIEKKL